MHVEKDLDNHTLYGLEHNRRSINTEIEQVMVVTTIAVGNEEGGMKFQSDGEGRKE